MVKSLILETERCLVRQLEPGDFEALAVLWADADVTRYMGGPRDPAKVKGALRDALGNPPEFMLWPTIEKTTGRVVGDFGLVEKRVDDRDEVEVVYVLAKAVWGRGYATEVAAALLDHGFGKGLDQVVALIDPANAASRRVAEKIGMHRERETIRPGDRRMDLFVARSATRSRTPGP